MMNAPFLSVALAAPLLFAPTTSPSSPQDADMDRRQEQVQPQLTVRYFKPAKAPVDSLQSALLRLMMARPGDSFRFVTLQTLGGTLLLQGPDETLPDVLKLARELDENYVGGAGQSPGIDQMHHQYRVRNVSLEHLEQALQFLDRNRMQQYPGQPRGLHLSYVYGSGMVQMSGSDEYVARAKQVIAEVDVPQPSLMLTCYLIRGRSEVQSDARIPAALARDLSALVPYEGFELMSSGMLPTNANNDMELRVDLEEQKGAFTLAMRPAAFDPDKGLLALSKVNFELSLNQKQTDDNGTLIGMTSTRRSFETSTSLATDRYSVLGAVGGDPVFVVVRLTQVGR